MSTHWKRSRRSFCTLPQCSPQDGLPDCSLPAVSYPTSHCRCPERSCSTTATPFDRQWMRGWWQQQRLRVSLWDRNGATLLFADEMLPTFLLQQLWADTICVKVRVELVEKHSGRGAVYKYYKSKVLVSLWLLSNMLSKRYIKVCRHFANYQADAWDY